MDGSPEVELGPGQRQFLPGTESLLDVLRQDATTPVFCVHGDGDSAVAIYEVPRGCVALPGVETQPLCQQHRYSDGSFERMNPVADLTIDAAWSGHWGETPAYYTAINHETGVVELLPYPQADLE